MLACRKAPGVAQLDWVPGSVQGGVSGDVGMQESTRYGPTGLGPRFGAGRGQWGCRHAGKHQVRPNWT